MTPRAKSTPAEDALSKPPSDPQVQVSSAMEGTSKTTVDSVAGLQEQFQKMFTAQQDAFAKHLQALEERFARATLSVDNAPKPSTERDAHPSFSQHSSLADFPSSLVKLKPSSLPSFTGADPSQCDVDDWIEQVQAIFDYSCASEQQLLSLLPMVLKGIALDWFTGLGPTRHTYKTWNDWKDALRNAFRPPNFEARIHHQLTRRTLKDNESFSEYFHAKSKLINRRWGNNVSDSIKMEEIISGMPSPMHALIRTHMASSTKSMESLRRSLMDLEEGLRAQFGHDNMSLDVTSSDSTSSSDNYFNGSVRDPQEVTCYKCHQQGHYANKCPERQTDSSGK